MISTSDETPVFLDTNILVYALDPEESIKQPRARAALDLLMRTNRLVISTQVLQEFYITITRKVRKPMSAQAALAFIDDLSAWEVVVADVPLIRDAIGLSEGASVSFWDALILAAAARGGASTVWTEDLNPGERHLGVQIVNPLLEDVSDVRA